MNILKRVFKNREAGLSIIIIIFILLMFFTIPEFKSSINIFGILYGVTVNLIIAGALTILFVSGGFDMSVGVTMGYCGMISAWLLYRLHVSIPAAIILTILVGAIIGAIIGFFISYVGMDPFIVTLAAWFVISSLVYIVNGGMGIGNLPENFYLISSYKILHVPMIIIFAILSAVVFDLLLRKNAFFRQYYAIGGNEKAAVMAGIKVKQKKLVIYILSSIMASIAGVFLTSRFMSGLNSAGYENAFQIITAIIIGGASLKGGRGSVFGTFLGLIFMALVYDALVLYKLDILWNKVAIGLFLILAIVLDENLIQRRRVSD